MIRNNSRFLKKTLSKNDKKTLDVQGLKVRMDIFLHKFKSFFTLPNSSSDRIYKEFVKGLFLSDLSNCESLSEKVSSNSQSLNHFISNSPWDYKALLNQVALYFTANLPNSWKKDLCLAIDESSFPKKGNESCGVGHQYCGELGKLANCQAGVFAGLICRNLYCLTDAILYLPKKWCEAKGRDIPNERKEYKTKIDLAKEIIINFKDVLKIPFQWVTFDSYYGRDQRLLRELADKGIIFVADVPKDATVYLKEPKASIPEKKGKRGRKNTRYVLKGKALTVERVAKQIKESSYRNIILRVNKEGKAVKAKYYKIPVCIAEKEKGTVLQLLLVVRKNTDGTIKYILTNAINEKLERIAYMHGRRNIIEKTFKEGKQNLGMGDYQVRGFHGWHRHMAMTALAMLFLQEEKYYYCQNGKEPSIAILCKIIKKLLPAKILSLQDLLKQIKNSEPVKKNKNRIKSVT